MIRLYEDGDLERIDYNEYVDLELFGDRLIQMLKIYSTYILEDDGEIISVLSFREYTDNCYSGFFICSKKINAKYVLEMKEWIEAYIKEFNVKRIETLSIADRKIDKMHEFLGLELEGTKRKFFKDRDYNIWGQIYGF